MTEGWSLRASGLRSQFHHRHVPPGYLMRFLLGGKYVGCWHAYRRRWITSREGKLIPVVQCIDCGKVRSYGVHPR